MSPVGAIATQPDDGRHEFARGADVSTARAQPFSINVIDDVKPFEAPRPTRKPRARSTVATPSTPRKTAAQAKTRSEARPKAQAQTSAPLRTTHYALRLEPITLGPAPGPAPTTESTGKVDGVASKPSDLIHQLSELVRPVTIAAERRQAIIWCGAAFAISLSLLFAALHGAISMRQRSEARMSQIERQIAIRTHNVAVRARDVSEAHAIDNTNMGARDLDRVLADLGWTEAAKSREALLRNWNWSPDQFTADANRAAAFSGADRPVRRHTGSAKRGVWSFTITQATPNRMSPIATSAGRNR